MSTGPKAKAIEFPEPVSQQLLGRALLLRSAFIVAYRQWDRVAGMVVQLYGKYGDVPGTLKQSAWGFSVSLIDTKLMYCRTLHRLRRELVRSHWRVAEGRWTVQQPSNKNSETISVIDTYTGDVVKLGAGAIPSDLVMVLKNRRSLGVEWSSVNFTSIFGKRLAEIRKKNARKIFDGQYGEIIYDHDREVRSLKSFKVYLECVATGEVVLQRFAFRFPYLRPGRKKFHLVAVIAFDASIFSILAG
jgi:hypothetical protein